jgi:hypothetical protein
MKQNEPMKKKVLPNINWHPKAGVKAAALQRWLVEWKMAEDTAGETTETLEEPASHLKVAGARESLVAPFDKTEPVRGEVRLLSSRLLPSAKRPVYVLVMGDWEDGLKLVAPFGPMLEPATPGELKTDRPEFCLSVLCLWNAHSVPVSRLQWGWVVDHLPENTVEEAWSVFRHAATGSPLTAALEERVGLPILDPEDPRTIYQAREFNFLSPLSEGILQGSEKQRILHFPSFDRAMEDERRAIAASSESNRIVVKHLRCNVPNASVSVVLRPDTCRAFYAGAQREGSAFRPAFWYGGCGCVRVSTWQKSPVLSPILRSRPAFRGIALRGAQRRSFWNSSMRRAGALPHHSTASLFLRACNPEGPALFSDSQLALIFSCENLPAEIEAALSGEILLRLWLYKGEGSPSLNANVQARINPALREAFGQRRDSDGLREVEQNPFPEHSSSRTAWAVYSRRAASFLRADGLIPVLVGAAGDEAVPIPFLFRPGLPAEIKVMDAGGCILENWSRSVCRLEAECVSGLGFVIETHVGAEAEHFEGDSFALPVLIAKLRAEGALPDFHPLRSARVRRCAAQASLESCWWAGGEGGPRPANGCPVFVRGWRRGRNSRAAHRFNGCVRRFSRGCKMLRCRNSPQRQLRDAIRLIGEEMRSGQITLETAELRVSWHREALESIGAEGLGSEARLLALSLQGSISNHKGDADLAARLNREAREEALRMKNPRAYVEASANQVVSLTDLRLLSEAEDLGRTLY